MCESVHSRARAFAYLLACLQILLMKSHQEVFNQIHLCNLTSDLGGTLAYDHAMWVKFHEVKLMFVLSMDTNKPDQSSFEL